MKPLELEVNRKRYSVEVDPETPLLCVLREVLGLTGAKYGCGEGQCGACTVLLGGAPRRSCQLPVRAAAAHVRFFVDTWSHPEYLVASFQIHSGGIELHRSALTDNRAAVRAPGVGEWVAVATAGDPGDADAL